MLLFRTSSIAYVLFLLVTFVLVSPRLIEAEEEGGPESSAQQAAPEYLSSTPTGEQVPWRIYLALAGNKLGCFFTIELLYNDDDVSRSLLRRCVVDNRQVSSVDDVIAKLGREVQGILFVRNATNRLIVHAIDERLTKTADYALDKSLTVTFSGVLDDLVSSELKARLPTIGTWDGGLMMIPADDYVTKVTVDAKDQKVRDILTDCVPLDVYGPILWEAGTRDTDGTTRTHVQYLGPDTHNKAIEAREYAVAMAEKLDCYLTIERLPLFDANGVMRWSPFWAYLARADEVDTVEGFVERLRRELDGVRVIWQPGTPSVIHLVEEPLLKAEDYFMNQMVDLDYSGPLGGMLVALQSKYPDLGLTTKNDNDGTDKLTPVRVAVKNKMVRDVLTASVPLKGYQRILWESETVKKRGKYVSWVRYSGPKPPREKPGCRPVARESSSEETITPQHVAGAVHIPPPTVCATTMAGMGLLGDLCDKFTHVEKEGGTIGLDVTTRWFPFVEFMRGRFAGVLYTSVPPEERRLVESNVRGPLLDVLLGEFRLLAIVHPSNTVESLDLRGIACLLQDGCKTWSLVGGHDLKVACYLENEHSTSRELIQWKCMTWRTETGGGRHAFRDDAIECTNPAEVIRKVAADRSGFGLFLYNPLDDKIKTLLKRVKVLPVGRTPKGPFVTPKLEPILQSDYPLAEPFVMFLHPNAPLVVEKFSKFCVSPSGARIAETHGLITRREQNEYEGGCRLKEIKAGKGTPILACDFAGGEQLLKDLSLEYVKAKAAVQLKFQRRETRDEAVAGLAEGTTELLLLDEPIAERGTGTLSGGPHPGPLPAGEGKDQSPIPGPQSLRKVKLGRMAVGIIVHPDNPLESLPLDEAKAIFCGEVKQWPAVRGAAAAMHVVGLRHDNPIAELLKEKLISGERGKVLKYTAQPDTEKVILAVARDPAAIGFVDMSQLPPTEKSVKLVKILGETPAKSTKEAGTEGDSPLFAPQKSGPSPLAADSLPEDYPLARTLVLYVSPKASQTAKDFADFLTPEHCKEVIAQYSLLPPLHAEASQLAGRPHPNPLPTNLRSVPGEGTRLASADEPIPLLLDEPDASQDHPKAKKPVAKAKQQAATPEQPEPSRVAPDTNKPAPGAASESAQPTQTQPGAPSLSDKEMIWLVCGVAGVVLLAVGWGWLSAPRRRKARR